LKAAGQVEKHLPLHKDSYALCSAAIAFATNLCFHMEVSTILVAKTSVIKVMLEVAHGHLKSNPNIIIRACRCLENMARASQEVRDKMKDVGCIEALTKWLSTDMDDVRTHIQSAIDAINHTQTSIDAMNVITMKGPLRAARSAKDLFGDATERKVPVLSRETRNFLTSGDMLLKHSKTAQPRPRHVKVTDDLKYLVWKDPKKPITADTRLKVFKIRSVDRGRCTPQLQRRAIMKGKFLAREECSFAVFARDRESLDLECDSEALREKWINAIEELVAYIKAEKEAQKFQITGVLGM
jgi:hypothetical protein